MFKPVIPIFLISCLTSIAIYAVLGPTLGLAFAAFAFASIVAPIVGADAPRALFWPTQASLILPVIVACIVGAVRGNWPYASVIWIGLLLASYEAAVSLASRAIARVVPSPLASAVVILSTIAWLSWPAWASGWVNEAWASRLVGVHPLFVVNAVTGYAPWTQHDVIYGLTRLGQDVSYAMPTTPWPAIMVNVLVAGIAGFAAFYRTGDACVAPTSVRA